MQSAQGGTFTSYVDMELTDLQVNFCEASLSEIVLVNVHLSGSMAVCATSVKVTGYIDSDIQASIDAVVVVVEMTNVYTGRFEIDSEFSDVLDMV